MEAAIEAHHSNSGCRMRMAPVQECAAPNFFISRDAVAVVHVVVAGAIVVINASIVLLGLESVAAVKVPQLVSEQEQCTLIEGFIPPSATF